MAATPAAATDQSDGPRLLKEESLYGGAAVRRTFEGGAVAVVTAGSRVEFGKPVRTEDDDGTIYETMSISVTPPDASSSEEVKRRQAAYEAAGRSPYKDALAAGMSQQEARAAVNGDIEPLNIWDSGCVYSGSDVYTGWPRGEVQWDGCYRRNSVAESDASFWYSGEDTQASGWGDDFIGDGELIRGRTAVYYADNYSEVVSWSPSSTYSYGQCTTVNLSAGAYGSTVGVSVPVCPNEMRPGKTQHHHAAEWRGVSGSRADTVAAGTATIAKIPEGFDSGFRYEITAMRTCFIC